MNTITHPPAEQVTLAEVAAEKRDLLAQLPAFERELRELELLEADEREQFSALAAQHAERLAHLEAAKRRARAAIGRCHAAGEWLRVNRPAL